MLSFFLFSAYFSSSTSVPCFLFFVPCAIQWKGTRKRKKSMKNTRKYTRLKMRASKRRGKIKWIKIIFSFPLSPSPIHDDEQSAISTYNEYLYLRKVIKKMRRRKMLKVYHLTLKGNSCFFFGDAMESQMAWSLPGDRFCLEFKGSLFSFAGGDGEKER